MPRCVHRGSADPTRGRPPPTAGLRRSPAPRTRGVRPGWFDGLALDRPFAVSRMDGTWNRSQLRGARIAAGLELRNQLERFVGLRGEHSAANPFDCPLWSVEVLTRGDNIRAYANCPHGWSRRDGHRLHAPAVRAVTPRVRSEEHTSELQSLTNLVCRLLL